VFLFLGRTILKKSAPENAIALVITLVVFACLVEGLTVLTAYVAKRIAIAQHQVSMCDRYATVDLRSNDEIVAKFNECLKGF
jgi:hypothetical protein